MQQLPFLFSNEKKYRLVRHIIFWLVVFLGQASVNIIVPTVFNRYNEERVFEATWGQLLYLPGQLFLVYTLLYFVIPRFILKPKYKLGFLWIAVLCVITGFIGSLSYWLLFDKLVHFYFGNKENTKSGFSFYMPVGFVNGLKAAIGVAGFASAIKLMKHWYEKEYRNAVLQKEKLNAELQSLKAQLHPHFLFNTLNNIYSITQNVSSLASEMLVKLSDLLRYILYDCDKPKVQLSKDIKVLQDYIELEKIRYGKNLELDVLFPNETNGYSIAPLLLLPLVENCFKHGSSKLLEQPWIKIDVEIKESILYAKLINGKPAHGSIQQIQYGIGLGNVQKRLDLIYPGKHELKIISEQEIFIVNLKLELEKTNSFDEQAK